MNSHRHELSRRQRPPLRFERLERRAMLSANGLSAEETFASQRGQMAPPLEQVSRERENVLFGPFQQNIDLSGFASSSEEAAFPENTNAYDTVVNHGPSSNRVDIVILGDGYTTSQIDTVYVTHVNNMLDYLFNAAQDPFPRYTKFFNAHRVNVVSNESGADKAPEGFFADTALDARYYCNNIERLICVSNSKSNAAKNSALAGAGFASEMDFVTVNDTKYGGSGGTYAVFAGGNGSANELALHEVAHSFDRLADEYGGSPNYSGPEPSEVNVTTNPAGAKWDRWIGYQQPVIGTIGAYEGGRYFDQGIYRPSINSKMRSLGRPFDAVSREKIILDIYDLVDPIDSWRDNSVTIRDASPDLWVQPIDTDVQDIQWSVDGVIVNGAAETLFDPTEYGFGEGSYTVSAKVFDSTDWVRHQNEKLEQTVQWTVEVLAAPQVSSIAINDGESTRSLLTSVDVTFSEQVTLTSDAFSIRNRATDEMVNLQVTASSGTHGTVATIEFLPGPSAATRSAGARNSLNDGTYELLVIADQVTAVNGGSQMNSNHVFGNEASDLFYRLFGDSDGDRDVDGQDYGRFGLTFLKSAPDADFNPWLDFDGDQDVDGQDYGQFGLRFLTTLPH